MVSCLLTCSWHKNNSSLHAENQSINENKFRVISKSFIKRFFFAMSRVWFFAAMYNNALCNVILIHTKPMCLLLFAFVLFCSVYTCIYIYIICIALFMFYLLCCVYSHSHLSFVYEHVFLYSGTPLTVDNYMFGALSSILSYDG